MVLAAQPDVRRYAAKLFQARRHLRGDGSFSGKNAVESLAGDAKVSRRLTDRQINPAAPARARACPDVGPRQAAMSFDEDPFPSLL